MEWRLLFYLRKPTDAEECGWPYRFHHFLPYYMFYRSGEAGGKPRLDEASVRAIGAIISSASVLGLLVGIAQLLITVF